MIEKDAYSELSSIRNLMERSAKFISLSGLSGILAGVYALIGAAISYKIVYQDTYRVHYVNETIILTELFIVALVVLILSLTTGIWLTIRKAKKNKQNFWNTGSRNLLLHMAIPLSTGGLFILILLFRGAYEAIAPACLIFYGLALVAGSHYTFTDVKWLGICEILLGLLTALLPGSGLIFWTIGFSFLHILYGTIMHFKYD